MGFLQGTSRFDGLRDVSHCTGLAGAGRGQSALKDHKTVRLTQPGGENAGAWRDRHCLRALSEARQGSSARMAVEIGTECGTERAGRTPWWSTTLDALFQSPEMPAR